MYHTFQTIERFLALIRLTWFRQTFVHNIPIVPFLILDVTKYDSSPVEIFELMYLRFQVLLLKTNIFCLTRVLFWKQVQVHDLWSVRQMNSDHKWPTMPKQIYRKFLGKLLMTYITEKKGCNSTIKRTSTLEHFFHPYQLLNLLAPGI